MRLGYEPALKPLLQVSQISRDWIFIAEQPTPAPHLAHPEGCAALRIVLVTVPCASRSCEQREIDREQETAREVQRGRGDRQTDR